MQSFEIFFEKFLALWKDVFLVVATIVASLSIRYLLRQRKIEKRLLKSFVEVDFSLTIANRSKLDNLVSMLKQFKVNDKSTVSLRKDGDQYYYEGRGSTKWFPCFIVYLTLRGIVKIEGFQPGDPNRAIEIFHRSNLFHRAAEYFHLKLKSPNEQFTDWQPSRVKANYVSFSEKLDDFIKTVF